MQDPPTSIMGAQTPFSTVWPGIPSDTVHVCPAKAKHAPPAREEPLSPVEVVHSELPSALGPVPVIELACSLQTQHVVRLDETHSDEAASPAEEAAPVAWLLLSVGVRDGEAEGPDTDVLLSPSVQFCTNLP